MAQLNTELIPTVPLHGGGGRVVISVNPKSGRRSAADRVATLTSDLQRRGLEVTIDTDLDAVEQHARALYAAGELRALIGVGGDGTAAELTNRTPEGLPLAMLPAGNENLLARYVGWPRDPAALANMLDSGRVVRLDAAAANGRLFLLMAGCGFDGEVVRQVHARRTGHIRSSHYFKPVLQAVRSYKYPLLRAAIEAADDAAGEEIDPGVEGRWLFVFNFPCYGGGLRIAPHALANDGQLDVISFRGGSLWNGLRYAGGIALGRHARMRDVSLCRTPRLTISAPEGEEVPYQLDGDPGGVLPVTIEVLPARLSLIVP